jgi:hypothetical protein
MSWDSEPLILDDDGSLKSLETPSFLDDPGWPSVALAAFEAELDDTTESNTQGPIYQIDHSKL